jgi:hypothetical protein
MLQHALHGGCLSQLRHDQDDLDRTPSSKQQVHGMWRAQAKEKRKRDVVWDGLPTCPSSATQLGPRTQVRRCQTQPIARKWRTRTVRFAMIPGGFLHGDPAARAHLHFDTLRDYSLCAQLSWPSRAWLRQSAAIRFLDTLCQHDCAASTKTRSRPREATCRCACHAADVHCTYNHSINPSLSSIGRRPARPIGVLVAR